MKGHAGLVGYALAHLIIGAAYVWAGYLLFQSQVLTAASPPAMLQGLALAYFAWVAILLIGGAVHELGHAVVGRALDLRLIFVLLGPVRLYARGTALRADWNARWLTMPFATALAPPLGRSSRRAWVLALLAGPLASLALAALALGAMRWWNDAPSLVGAALAGLSWFGLAGFCGNLLPGRIGLRRTDGAYVLAVLRDDPDLASSWQVANVVAAWSGGARPRESSTEDIESLIALQGPAALRASALMLALLAARDRGDTPNEVAHAKTLATLIDALSPQVRAAACCELAISLAAQDTVGAAVWLERARRDRAEAGDRWRAEAAVALARGEDAQARKALGRARAALKGMSTLGLVAPVGEALDELERRLDARQVS